MENRLISSTSPHIHKDISIKRIMWLVFFSLVPAGIAGIFLFGSNTLWIILVSIISAVITELLIQCLRHQKISITDGSAVLTGLLLAYTLPPTLPLWMVALGSFFAIAICKQAFGGLGCNIFNPALGGRAFLLLSFPKYMVRFIAPFGSADSVTSATPLVLLKEGNLQSISQIGLSYMDLFLGRRSGSLGEVCIVLLLLGALFLLILRVISWHVPLSFILTLGITSWLWSGKNFACGDWLFAILSGGVILGAFFMATDYVSSPLTRKAQLIFGFGCGLITFVIRKWGGYPEGVCFSILIMNATVPLLDRFFPPRVYGYKK